MKTIKRWKFLREGLKSNSGNLTWKIGKWEKCGAELSMCNHGLHCSKEINQAFSFVSGEVLAKVEVKGKKLVDDDKECYSDMRIVKAWKWTKKDSVSLAIYAAELVIGIYEKKYPKDDRPRKAIEAAKNWLKHPTKKNKIAANAAVYAASNAANAAVNAANAAYAAYAANAANAAYAANAVREESVAKIETWMVKRVKKLEEIK